MTFTFDAEKARKRTPAPANPAKAANPSVDSDPASKQISGISNISGTTPPDPEAFDWGYTAADLVEMDRLIRQLAELEGWSEEELAAKLDELGRMAPINVPDALKRHQAANAAALAPWPNPPKERAVVRLCLLTGVRK